MVNIANLLNVLCQGISSWKGLNRNVSRPRGQHTECSPVWLVGGIGGGCCRMRACRDPSSAESLLGFSALDEMKFHLVLEAVFEVR
jgi:hypothetical protein